MKNMVLQKNFYLFHKKKFRKEEILLLNLEIIQFNFEGFATKIQ
jgi:hypothetical protein